MAHLYQNHLQNQWSLYEEEKHDAIVKVGDKEFKVLKCFFMAQSLVFKCIFESDLNKAAISIIEIEDIEEATMEQLTRWMYTGQFEDESKVENLFLVAYEYKVKLLKEKCVEVMTRNFEAGNILSRLILANSYGNDQLMENALKYIKRLSAKDLSNCFTSHEWIDYCAKNAYAAKEIGDMIRGKMNEEIPVRRLVRRLNPRIRHLLVSSDDDE